MVGTPGRLLECIREGLVGSGGEVGGVRAVVLDEADKMLGAGLREDVEKVM